MTGLVRKTTAMHPGGRGGEEGRAKLILPGSQRQFERPRHFSLEYIGLRDVALLEWQQKKIGPVWAKM